MGTRVAGSIVGHLGFAWVALGALALAPSACAPSSGTGVNPALEQTFPGGTAATGPGGNGANAGASGASAQGAGMGAGGIVGQSGAGGNLGGGGMQPGDGAAPGTGGDLGTGGIPAEAGGTCGTSSPPSTTYPACTTCTGGLCVPTSALAGAPVNILAACDANDVCVPEQIVNQGANVLLRACKSIGGSEGRCTSLCIPAAANLSAYLPQDVCASDERCAPCYSPADGSATGVCSLGCDSGPTQAPYVFSQCCGGAGRCAPKDALPPDLAKQLGSETCPSTDLCVPAQPILNPAYRFPCCTTGPNNSLSGICAPACIIDQNPQGGVLTQATCNSGDKCVPCANPLTGQPTGACTDTKGQSTSTCVP